ncbi:hypothetical protein PRZ48_008747 [Zasmidium cellare]|uniref:Uncharacterized protein n=1 Tax=Zasmidium cellare TaxID=395010 RepID=A0ABR0EHL0_ZASCE|nr:hypothetical protein PRZ48_008747 [Zasmidium cellare]
MNCRLDDFDTYNDYYVTFQRLVAEFEALPGCEKLGEQHKFIIFSMNLGPYFRPWINDLSTSYNIAGIGSSKPEKIGFLQFDRKIRDFGLNAARHQFWKKRIQWRSHCTYEIIDSTGFIPKWFDVPDGSLLVYSIRAPFTPYSIDRRRLFLQAPKTKQMVTDGGRLFLSSEPRAVHLFLTWLETGQLLYASSLDEAEILAKQCCGELNLDMSFRDEDLADVYVLASNIDAPKLQNDVMSNLIMKHKLSRTPVRREAFLTVVRGLGLDNLFIEYAMYEIALQAWDTVAKLPKDLDALPPKFSVSLLKACVSNAERVQSGQLPAPVSDLCQFHRHLDDQETDACKKKNLTSQFFYDDSEDDFESVSGEQAD